MSERRSVRRGKVQSAAAVAAALMLGAAALRGENLRKPSNQEQLKQFHESWVAAGKPQTASATLAPKWGTNNIEVVNVHAYDFQANTSSNLIMDDGNGYRYFGDEAVPYMAAPVRLPSGAHIESIAVSHCSANDGDLVFGLYDNGQGGSGGGGGTLIAGPLTTASGCVVTLVDAPYTYVSNLGHPLYVVVFFAGGQTDGSAKFNDFSVFYTRQVSPPPAQASFGDVPTTDFGFQYVEALAASGITGGCGGGNYCPDTAVTRRQMAIFLAKALGLHWAD
jgi:S-layer homology domain